MGDENAPAEKQPFKDYNEMLKTFENLAKREGELLQKLSQGEHVTADEKTKWAEELHAIVKATATLDRKRKTITETLETEIDKRWP